jgi:hypothetical protein
MRLRKRIRGAMKNYLQRGLLLTLALLALAPAGCTTTKGLVKNPRRLENIHKVAVLPFHCRRYDVGETIADSLTMQLMESRFSIIERSQLDKLLREQGLSVSGLLENYEYLYGKLKGIDAIIVGSATMSQGFAGWMFGGYVEYVSGANARLIDLQTGEVLLAATITSSTPNTQYGLVTPTKVGYWLGKEIIKKTK